MRSLRQDSTKRICDEASTPEFDPVCGGMVTRSAHHFAVVFHISIFVPHAVHCADEDSIGDGVGALDGLPGVILPLTELGLLAWKPANRRREEEGFGAL